MMQVGVGKMGWAKVGHGAVATEVRRPGGGDDELQVGFGVFFFVLICWGRFQTRVAYPGLICFVYCSGIIAINSNMLSALCGGIVSVVSIFLLPLTRSSIN